MGADDKDNVYGEYASPPCFMHELDPAYAGVTASDPQATRDVSRWRKAARDRLIAERLAIPSKTRMLLSKRIAQRLDDCIGEFAGRVVGVYWPFRGEPNLHPWMRNIVECGGRIALPLVAAKAMPLVFMTWAPGEKLDRGVWNIPVPAAGETVIPNVVISPLVGFDAARYRLGYGGGYYDRTLAAMPSKPLVIGVGYENSRLATIYPQSHDIPMDELVVA